MLAFHFFHTAMSRNGEPTLAFLLLFSIVDKSHTRMVVSLEEPTSTRPSGENATAWGLSHVRVCRSLWAMGQAGAVSVSHKRVKASRATSNQA